MALTKEKIHHLSSLSSKFQSCVFDETTMEINSLMSHHGVNNYQKSMVEEEDGSQSNDSAHSPPFCGSSNNGYVYKNISYQLEEQKSLINFKANAFNNNNNNIMQSSESLLSFQQSWMVSNENNLHQGYNYNNEDFSSCYGSIFNSSKEKQGGESSCGWLYSEPNVMVDSLKESTTQESLLKKRSYMGENMQGGNAKKPCTSASKAAKHKSNPSKDPQSVAAKNRRERISERLKTLQELVPNGSKVDLVTMLEKAISYVKFLQLQVKVLAADEFWPVQSGKAPDIAQVRQAIDAILSPQR